MIVSTALVEASQSRWSRHSKVSPHALGDSIGELRREGRVTVEQKERRYASLLAQMRSPIAARSALERILAGNDLVGINYLELGSRAARAICRIHLRNADGATVGFGTGFLVGPGVVMTNHHVISTSAQAKYATAEFDYEYDWRGLDKPVAAFSILSNPPFIASEPLDFCLLPLSEKSKNGRSLREFGWLPLNPSPGKAFIGEYLSIIQHPGGERKQVCVRENKLLKFDENGSTIWYMTDTVAGSSGSPVMNGSWQVVALHHSGVPKKDSQGRWLTVDGRVWDSSMDESQVAWEANEGIRISRIVEFLKARFPSHSITKAIVNGAKGPQEALDTATSPNQAGSQTNATSADGELRLIIPVEIKVRIGDHLPPPPSPNGAHITRRPAVDTSLEPLLAEP